MSLGICPILVGMGVTASDLQRRFLLKEPDGKSVKILIVWKIGRHNFRDGRV